MRDLEDLTREGERIKFFFHSTLREHCQFDPAPAHRNRLLRH